MVTKTLLERGFSFPPSKFFADFLKTFNLQPQHISPNSVTALSGFVTLCEGFLGIEPTIELLMFYFSVKREPSPPGEAAARTSAFTLKKRENRTYPYITPHQSIRLWSGTFLYCKDLAAPGEAQGLPPFEDVPASENEAWSMLTELDGDELLTRYAKRISHLVHNGLTGIDTVLNWFVRRIQPLQHRDRLMHLYAGSTDPMRITPGELVTKVMDERLRKLIDCSKIAKLPNQKIKDFTIKVQMYEGGSCPNVSFSAKTFHLRFSVNVHCSS